MTEKIHLLLTHAQLWVHVASEETVDQVLKLSFYETFVFHRLQKPLTELCQFQRPQRLTAQPILKSLIQ